MFQPEAKLVAAAKAASLLVEALEAAGLAIYRTDPVGLVDKACGLVDLADSARLIVAQLAKEVENFPKIPVYTVAEPL
jgi:hypothetical protein